MDNTGNNEFEMIPLRREDRTQGMIDIARDFILPDMYADIKRILFVTGKMSPDGCYVSGAKATFGARSEFCVGFVTDEEEVRCAAFTCDFEGSVTVDENIDSDIAFMPRFDSINARSVNPRKIGIKARVNPGIYVWENRDCSAGYPDSLNYPDRMTFEERTERIYPLKMKSFSVSGVESGDDIAIENTPAVKDILFCTVNFSDTGAQSRENAVAVSAVADVAYAYTYEDREGVERVCFATHELPVSYLMETEGVKEGDRCFARLHCDSVSFYPADNAAGQAKTIELDFSYSILCCVCSTGEADIVKDIYSTVYDCEGEQGEIKYSSYVKQERSSVKCACQTQFKEDGEVIGVVGSVKNACLAESPDKAAELSAQVSLSVIIKESDGSTVCENIDMPLSAPLGAPYSGCLECLSDISLRSCAASLSDGRISAQATVSVSAVLWENRKEKCIRSVAVTGKSALEDRKAFTVYYPCEGESLWDIAKKYRVTRNSLILANSDKGTAEGKKALIIPKNKKSIFSGRI